MALCCQRRCTALQRLLFGGCLQVLETCRGPRHRGRWQHEHSMHVGVPHSLRAAALCAAMRFAGSSGWMHLLPGACQSRGPSRGTPTQPASCSNSPLSTVSVQVSITVSLSLLPTLLPAVSCLASHLAAHAVLGARQQAGCQFSQRRPEGRAPPARGQQGHQPSRKEGQGDAQGDQRVEPPELRVNGIQQG